MTMLSTFPIFQVSVSSPIRWFQMLLFFVYSFREKKIFIWYYTSQRQRTVPHKKVECNAEIVSIELKTLSDDTLSVDLG